MIVLSDNLRRLEGELVGVCTYAIDDKWRPWYRDANEAYENFRLSLAHLRKKLGELKYHKLLDMMEIARVHFEEGHEKGGDPGMPGDEDIKLGAWLMQDMGQVIRGKVPFAYPRDLWRWGAPFPVDPDTLTEADL
jgi:hypothetical protein